MNNRMTVEQATELLGCTRQELANALHVSKMAVSQWARSGYLPIAREYQVRDLAEGRTPLVSTRRAA